MLLHTDGLVERRNPDDRATVDLRNLVAAGAGLPLASSAITWSGIRRQTRATTWWCWRCRSWLNRDRPTGIGPVARHGRHPMIFEELVERATKLATGSGRAILGVTGSPGSGKSTLVAALRERRPSGAVAHVPMDGFHLADVALVRIGRRDAKGAPDTFDAGGYVALLRRIRADAEDVIYAPAFERDLEQPLAGAIAVPRDARLVLTEGNYLLLDSGRWPEVRSELDEVWFCDPDPAVRLAQLTARHLAFGKDAATTTAWVAAVDEPHAARVDATRPQADLVIPSSVLESLRPST